MMTPFLQLVLALIITGAKLGGWLAGRFVSPQVILAEKPEDEKPEHQKVLTWYGARGIPVESNEAHLSTPGASNPPAASSSSQ